MKNQHVIYSSATSSFSLDVPFHSTQSIKFLPFTLNGVVNFEEINVFRISLGNRVFKIERVPVLH